MDVRNGEKGLPAVIYAQGLKAVCVGGWGGNESLSCGRNRFLFLQEVELL